MSQLCVKTKTEKASELTSFAPCTAPQQKESGNGYLASVQQCAHQLSDEGSQVGVSKSVSSSSYVKTEPMFGERVNQIRV